jgi:hypothetical protein
MKYRVHGLGRTPAVVDEGQVAVEKLTITMDRFFDAVCDDPDCGAAMEQ